MIYNPIFEEELEKKSNLSLLKKDIKKRAKTEYMKRMFHRMYNLFSKKSVNQILESKEELTLKNA